jgi:hypothetical protein
MQHTIQTNLKQGVKLSAILPFLKIIAQQQKLDLTRLTQFNKAKRFLLISINQN